MKIFIKILEIIKNFPFTKPVLFALLLMCISGFFIYSTIKKMLPPPQVVTHYRFNAIEQRIRQLLNHDPQAEVNLKSLPALPEITNSVKDGWNHDIIYRKVNNTNHQLISLGEDGIKDGKTDLIHNFNT